MKTSRRQREKDSDKTKTKPPHSISASGSKLLDVSRKSQVIQKKTDKSTAIQSKLTSVKSEDGKRSLIVSRITTPSTSSKSNDTRTVKTVSTNLKPNAQVESKKNVEPQQKSGTVSRSNAAKTKDPIKQLTKVTENQNISCKHCNLHFSSTNWLKKHVAKCHATRVQKVMSISTKTDQKSNILNYKKQLDVIQQTLDKKKSKETHKKKQKISPTKHKLREQLKAQLAAQQKLLQVQQEIFEKTSKAQKDIFDLIAKLGDDDSDLEGEEVEEVDEVEEVVDCKGKPSQTNAGNAVKKEEYKPVPESQEEHYYPNNEPGELIVAENPDEFAYYPGEYDQQLLAEDNNFVMINDQNQAIVQDDQALMVIVRSGDDEEEFELIDVVEEQMYETNQYEQVESGINFEVVGTENNSVHCRIIANEEPQEEIEYVDVQLEKVPVKLEVGKIQEIAQKRFYKQEEDKKADENDSKVLNNSINKSEKHTNEYIQKVVQNAIPTDDNKFECPICNELVSNRYSLGPHILRLHSKQKSKICQYCDRSFTCTGDLTRHIRIHTGEKPFKCSYPNCTYAFRASGDLHKHMRRHNSATVNIRQHVCTQCDRAFERNYDLKRHELTHKKNEEGVGYNCEFCSKRFVRKDQHKAHVFRHLGIKQYKCPDCDRHFGDFSNCSKHIRQCQAGDVKPFGSDDSDTQYICEICNKRFKSKVGMKQHVVKCAKITELQKKLQDSFKQMEEE